MQCPLESLVKLIQRHHRNTLVYVESNRQRDLVTCEGKALRQAPCPASGTLHTLGSRDIPLANAPEHSPAISHSKQSLAVVRDSSVPQVLADQARNRLRYSHRIPCSVGSNPRPQSMAVHPYPEVSQTTPMRYPAESGVGQPMAPVVARTKPSLRLQSLQNTVPKTIFAAIESMPNPLYLLSTKAHPGDSPTPQYPTWLHRSATHPAIESLTYPVPKPTQL